MKKHLLLGIASLSLILFLGAASSDEIARLGKFVNPVVAVLLGWAYAGEALTTRVGMAAALVVLAVVLVDRGTNRLRQLL